MRPSPAQGARQSSRYIHVSSQFRTFCPQRRSDLKQNRKLLILCGGIRRLRGKISLRRSSGRPSLSRRARWAERRATHTIILMVRPIGIDPMFEQAPKRPAPVLRCGWTTRRSRGVSSGNQSDRSATSFTLNDPLESSPFLVETLHGSRLVTQPSSSISSTSSPQSSALA